MILLLFFGNSISGSAERPLINAECCSSSRKARILTAGIHGVFRGLKFSPGTGGMDSVFHKAGAEAEQKGAFCKGFDSFYKVIHAALKTITVMNGY